MRKVRVFMGSDPITESMLLNRQTKYMTNNVYKDIEFVYDESYEYSIFINESFKTNSPKENNRCFLMEPPEIFRPRIENSEFVKYYHSFNVDDKNRLGDKFRYSNMQNTLHTNINTDSPLPSKKPKNLSVIVSGKAGTPYHRQRLAVVFELLRRPNVAIDIYGRDNIFNDHRYKGSLPVFQKEESLKHYSYSIALENSQHIGYLSEKFIDCIVNNCIPITNNKTCENFPNSSYRFVDFTKPIPAIVDDILCITSVKPTIDDDNAIIAANEFYQNSDWNFCESIYNSLTY